MLPSDGLLAVMTRLHPGPRDFPEWWYHKDPTHVRFYSRKTFLFIEQNLGWEIAAMDERDTVALIRTRCHTRERAKDPYARENDNSYTPM